VLGVQQLYSCQVLLQHRHVTSPFSPRSPLGCVEVNTCGSTTPGAPPKHLSNKPSDPITASLTCKPLEHSRAQALLLSLADQRSRGSLVSSVLLSANTTRSWVGKLNKRACNEKQGRLGGKGHEDQGQSTAGRHYARNYHNEMLVGRAMVYK
jgi:hypothetical protein